LVTGGKMKKLFLFTLMASLFFLTSFDAQAKKEKSLFVYVSMDEPIAKRLLEAYKKETGKKVEFVRLSTGEAAARITTEKYNPPASLWLGGVGLFHEQIKQKGLSTPYKPKGTEKIEARFRDPQNYWTGLYLGALCFTYNKKELARRKLIAPDSWQSLLDPKFKGHVQMANPGTSGTAYNAMTTLIGIYGEEKAFDYLKKLNKNISQYTRSGSAPAKNAVLGETVVALGYAHDAIRLMREDKAPLGMSFPKEGVGYEIASISVIKGAKQIPQAKKLYDWMYTKPPLR